MNPRYDFKMPLANVCVSIANINPIVRITSVASEPIMCITSVPSEPMMCFTGVLMNNEHSYPS